MTVGRWPGRRGLAVLTGRPCQPSHLYSPTTVLKCQRGNCFDFSTLLCSMLLGAGYDAYCVNGYGSWDLCHMDLTREVCPLTMKPKEVGPGARCPWHPEGVRGWDRDALPRGARPARAHGHRQAAPSSPEPRVTSPSSAPNSANQLSLPACLKSL